MFDRLAVGVHLVDVDAGDPGIIRFVIEKIQEVHMSPNIVADRNDAVNNSTGIGTLACNLAEVFSQRI